MNESFSNGIKNGKAPKKTPVYVYSKSAGRNAFFIHMVLLLHVNAYRIDSSH